jgi:hypothetical protein
VLRSSIQRPLLAVALAAIAATFVGAAPASALTCGSLNQPACVEDPPPGLQLDLAASENPYGLQPLTGTPSGSKRLWPLAHGHKPFGFNAVAAGRGGTTVDDEAFLHQQVGASMARIGADWAMIQYFPNTASGGPSWFYEAYLDPIYRAYVKRGIRPLLAIGRSPRRFTKNAPTSRNSNVTGCGTSDACWNPPVAAELGRLATFAADLARRYPLAAGIEVWNEPNLSNPFWGGEQPDPVHYTAMVKTVRDAVRAVRPAWPIVGGALASIGAMQVDASGYSQWATRTYLRRMVASGAATQMDAVSLHPYLGDYPSSLPTAKERSDALFTRIGAAMNNISGAYADAGQAMNDRVVVTEFGASTADGWSLDDQSYWLTMQFALWDGNHPNLALSSRTDAAFAHLAVDNPDPAFGTTGYGFTAAKDSAGRFATRPVFCSFRTTFGGFSDCPAYIAPPAG